MLSVGVKGFSSIGCYYPDLCDAAADSLAKRLDMGSFQVSSLLNACKSQVCLQAVTAF